MIEVEIAKRIDAPADRVWRMISGSELRDCVKNSYIEKIDVKGEGVGTILTTTFKGGGTIGERIEKLDPVEREYTYSVTDSGFLRYAYYEATMRCQPAGPKQTLLSIRCRFIAETGYEEETTKAWYASNSAKCDLIAEHLAKVAEPA
jgi:hypothetical protein